VQIFGTNTTNESSTSLAGQTIKIAGDGEFHGVIYAPNADVEVRGMGDTYGAVVGKNIFLGGNGQFHYDEALKDLDSDRSYRIARWRELLGPNERVSL
jgi:hypothetical protein